MAQMRSEVMWQAVVEAVNLAGSAPLDVLDLGGGTGLDAVRLGAQGHRVTVVDPSPDALASLARRADEADVTDRVRPVLGDSADLAEHMDPGTVDLTLCHGLLEYLENPAEALEQAGRVMRADAIISIIVPGRLGSVMSKALSGDFAAAEAMLSMSARHWDLKTDGPRRYIAEELTDLVMRTGYRPILERGVRVFADLVPSSLIDDHPRGRESLFALERMAGDSLRSVAAGLQSVARLE